MYVCVISHSGTLWVLKNHRILFSHLVGRRGDKREIYWLNEKLIDFSTFRQKSENSDNAKSYPHKAIKSSFSKPWDLGWKVQPNSSTDDMMSISVSVMTLSFVEVYSKNSKNQLWKISWIISSTITYKLQNSTYFAILETAGNRNSSLLYGGFPPGRVGVQLEKEQKFFPCFDNNELSRV